MCCCVDALSHFGVIHDDGDEVVGTNTHECIGSKLGLCGVFSSFTCFPESPGQALASRRYEYLLEGQDTTLNGGGAQGTPHQSISTNESTTSAPLSFAIRVAARSTCCIRPAR